MTPAAGYLLMVVPASRLMLILRNTAVERRLILWISLIQALGLCVFQFSFGLPGLLLVLLTVNAMLYFGENKSGKIQEWRMASLLLQLAAAGWFGSGWIGLTWNRGLAEGVTIARTYCAWLGVAGLPRPMTTGLQLPSGALG